MYIIGITKRKLNGKFISSTATAASDLAELTATIENLELTKEEGTKNEYRITQLSRIQ